MSYDHATALMEVTKSHRKHGMFIPDSELIIYPFVGFVLKTTFVNSKDKVFINICHCEDLIDHEMISTEAKQVRDVFWLNLYMRFLHTYIRINSYE
jgi:PIH1 N-terminal domain